MKMAKDSFRWLPLARTVVSPPPQADSPPSDRPLPDPGQALSARSRQALIHCADVLSRCARDLDRRFARADFVPHQRPEDRAIVEFQLNLALAVFTRLIDRFTTTATHPAVAGRLETMYEEILAEGRRLLAGLSGETESLDLPAWSRFTGSNLPFAARRLRELADGLHDAPPAADPPLADILHRRLLSGRPPAGGACLDRSGEDPAGPLPNALQTVARSWQAWADQVERDFAPRLLPLLDEARAQGVLTPDFDTAIRQLITAAPLLPDILVDAARLQRPQLADSLVEIRDRFDRLLQEALETHYAKRAWELHPALGLFLIHQIARRDVPDLVERLHRLAEGLEKLRKDADKSREAGGKGSEPEDLMTLTAVVKHYQASRTTCKRAIEEGHLKTYQRKPQGRHFVREKDVRGLYLPR